MYCRNYTGTVSRVLCREVYYTESLFGRVHYQRLHCSILSLTLAKQIQDCSILLVEVMLVPVLSIETHELISMFTYIHTMEPS